MPWVETEWSAEEAHFTMAIDKELPWEEDIIDPTGDVEVEIPRRSGEWTTLPDVMRIHTSNGKDTSSPRAPVEIGQAEVTCCNISKNFNSFEEASDWYKSLEGYAIRIKVGCDIGGSPISVKLFTGIISAVDVDRLSLTAEIKVVDFLDYFGRVTLKETPVWESISLTQLFKNLVELAFTDWTHGVDYFVEDLGGSTIPAIGYTDLNLLSELKMIAESRSKRIYTDTSGKLHCASRNPDRDPLTVGYDYNLEDVTERRDINSIINWVVVHARPHEIQPDLDAPGKIAGFTATPGDLKIDLSWSNPTNEDFEKVKIQFSTTAYPLNEDDGTNIYEGTGEAKSHTGLTNGTRYYYSAFTVDDVGNWSDAAHASAIAGEGGDAWEDETYTSRVTNFKAESDWDEIKLTWVNPKVADFSLVEIRWSITDYPEEVTDGTQLYQGSAQAKVHENLTLDQTYYYSAFAQNTSGRWSSGVHASATTGPTFREELDTASIQRDFQPGAPVNYWKSVNYRRFFSFPRSYSVSWLRFKHSWDIKIHGNPAHLSSQKHLTGEKNGLALNFTDTLGGVITIRCLNFPSYNTSHSVKVIYTITYSGGYTTRLEIHTTLALMG